MEESFDRVYGEHGGAIFGYLVRMTGDRHLAEEICQETFVRYLRGRESIRAANGTLAPWLYRVATRLVLDSRRRRAARPLYREPTVTPDVEAAAGDREVAERVRRAIDGLPDELRATFLLRAHEELTFPEVAAATGVSERAAKDRFRRARELLLTRLGPLLREIHS